MGRRRSPYYAKYIELGAELVDRIGYDAPLRFTTTEAEHIATRTKAGLYDVYHQGMVDIKGRDAEALLQKTCVNDISRIGDGEVIYSSVTNPAGGMIDDLTIYRVSSDYFFLSPTPSRVDSIVAHMTEHARGLNAYVTNMVSGTGFISVQGPHSRTIMERLTIADLTGDALPYYTFTTANVAEVDGFVARTGYSGEIGFEFFYPVEYGMHVWNAIFDAGQEFGLVPCGLGALRSVRIEKRYPLYGLDLNETTSPLEANLGWTVRFKKGDFIGRDALLRQKEEGVSRNLVAIELEDLTSLPVPGNVVTANDQQIGIVTSADRGYFVGRTIALGYLNPEAAVTGAQVNITLADGSVVAGIVNEKAAYDPEREIVRG